MVWPYQIKRGGGIYCSYKCSHEPQKNRKKVICISCNNEFDVTPSRLKKGEGKFCSWKCYKKFLKQNSTLIEVKCQRCGKSFKVKPNEYKKGWGKYCSKECEKNRIKRICKYCKNEFEIPHAWAKKTKGHGSFCSRKCHHNFSRKNPQYTSNWKGGISFEPYDSRFNDSLKLFIKERDNFTCQICFKKKDRKEDLAVHHIDYNKKNSDPNNLISVCTHPCHIQTNYNREYWQKVLTEYIKLWIGEIPTLYNLF